MDFVFVAKRRGRAAQQQTEKQWRHDEKSVLSRDLVPQFKNYGIILWK